MKYLTPTLCIAGVFAQTQGIVSDVSFYGQSPPVYPSREYMDV